jgi:hypothetical protein
MTPITKIVNIIYGKGVIVDKNWVKIWNKDKCKVGSENPTRFVRRRNYYIEISRNSYWNFLLIFFFHTWNSFLRKGHCVHLLKPLYPNNCHNSFNCLWNSMISFSQAHGLGNIISWYQKTSFLLGFQIGFQKVSDFNFIIILSNKVLPPNSNDDDQN